MSVACMYVCALCVCLVLKAGKKKVLDTLEQESQTVESCHVVAKNGIQVLCKNSQ